MTLRLNGDDSGFTEIKAPNAAGDNSITLPTSNGGANQLLQNGGTAGELQYTSAGAGLHYDSSGRLLVGASSSSANISALFQANSANSGGAGVVNIGRGASFTANNTNVGNLQFTNVDGDVLARIQCSSAGTSGGVNGNPGKLSFLTENQGSDDGPTERLRIGQNGLISLLNSPGIDFSGIQDNLSGMDSETLDHYETGSFSPTIKGWNGSYSVQHGAYIKIGRIVHIMGEVKTDASTGSSVDTFPGLAGLPFNHATDLNGSNSQRHMGTGTMLGSINITSGTTPIAFCTFDGHGSDAFFPNNVTGTGAGNFQSSFIQNLTTISFGYRFNCTYYS